MYVVLSIKATLVFVRDVHSSTNPPYVICSTNPYRKPWSKTNSGAARRRYPGVIHSENHCMHYAFLRLHLYACMHTDKRIESVMCTMGADGCFRTCNVRMHGNSHLPYPFIQFFRLLLRSVAERRRHIRHLALWNVLSTTGKCRATQSDLAVSTCEVVSSKHRKDA